MKNKKQNKLDLPTKVSIIGLISLATTIAFLFINPIVSAVLTLACFCVALGIAGVVILNQSTKNDKPKNQQPPKIEPELYIKDSTTNKEENKNFNVKYNQVGIENTKTYDLER